MTLQETIDRHIRISLLEYPCLNESLIFEKQGIPDMVVTIVNQLCSVIGDKLNPANMRVGDKRNIIITEDDFSGVETFFEECNVYVTCKKVIVPETSHGLYFTKQVGFDSESKKLKNAILSFDLFITGYDSVERFKPLFYHEFTHAYEDYRRRVGSEESLGQYGDKTKYYQNQQNTTFGVLSDCKHVIYFLSSSEKNAFMAMIRGELEGIPSSDANEMMKRLKRGRLWSLVERVEEEIKRICSLTDIEAQRKVVKYFRDNGYDKVKNYRHLVKCLEKYWLNFKERAGKVAGKQISQMISEMKTGAMDFGLGGY
jgi:hypothetical protein